jgi:hypothetical protein
MIPEVFQELETNYAMSIEIYGVKRWVLFASQRTADRRATQRLYPRAQRQSTGLVLRGRARTWRTESTRTEQHRGSVSEFFRRSTRRTLTLVGISIQLFSG